jgi:hypothetical protein
MARRKVSAADKKSSPPNADDDDVRDLTDDILGGDIPKNPDGSVQAEAEIEIDQAKKIGALDQESVARNRRDARNINRARHKQPVRWNEEDARIMFGNVKRAWPTGVRILIKRVEPTPEEYRPVDIAGLKDSLAFYDYVAKYIHKRSPAAKYKCTFRDDIDRGTAFLNMPDTTGSEDSMGNGMGGNGYGGGAPPGFPGGGMPYMPPMPPYGQPYGYPGPGGAYPGYPPQGYYPPAAPPYGPPQGAPPPPYGQPPQAPPPAAPPAAQGAEQAYGQQTAPPPQAPPPQPPPQNAYAPQFSQPQNMPYPPYPYPPPPAAPAAPPRDTALEAQVAAMFWQFNQMQESSRQNQLQLERALGALEARDRQDFQRGQVPQPAASAAPPSAPAPPPSYGQPSPYAPGGFAHMGPPPSGLAGAPPPAFSGAAPGYGAPPPAYTAPPPQAPPQAPQQVYDQWGRPIPGYMATPPAPQYDPWGRSVAPQGAPQYAPPPAPAPAQDARSTNPLAEAQRTLQQTMEQIGIMNRSMEEIKRMALGETEEPEQGPGMPMMPTPDKPVPFQTMPLGPTADAPIYAYNEHDGSPNFLGIALANGPRVAGWFKGLGDTISKFQAAQAAEAARAAQQQHPGTITVQPEQPMQPPPQYAPPPPPFPQQGGFPMGSIRSMVGG